MSHADLFERPVNGLVVGQGLEVVHQVGQRGVTLQEGLGGLNNLQCAECRVQSAVCRV